MQLTRASKTQARVVVTGVGTVTPLGTTMEETWKNAIQGVSGIGPITHFDASAYDVRFAGEVKNFQTDEFIQKKNKRKWTSSSITRLRPARWLSIRVVFSLTKN